MRIDESRHHNKSPLRTEYPLEPNEMSIGELKELAISKQQKARVVQEQLAALSLPGTLELVYRDESGSVIGTERSEWLEFYYELLGKTDPI